MRALTKRAILSSRGVPRVARRFRGPVQVGDFVCGGTFSLNDSGRIPVV